MRKTIGSKIYSILVFAFLYLPIGVLVLYSFNSADSTGVFKGFSLKWYKELFSDGATLNALKNTLVLAVLSSVIATIIGTAAAYGISKMRNKPLKNATMSVTQVPMINPEIVTGISFARTLTGEKQNIIAIRMPIIFFLCAFMPVTSSGKTVLILNSIRNL